MIFKDGILIPMIIGGILAGLWLMHASDRADLSQIDRQIVIVSEQYEKAKETIGSLNEGEVQFRMNADSPVASLVKSQMEIANRLTGIRIKKTTILAGIVSRCNGPWRPVVWAFDDVTCAEYRKM